MNSMGFAARGLRRQWRRGELLVLVGALTIAVASAAAVGLFNDRVLQAMTASGSEAIAADLRLELRSPISPARREQIVTYNLTLADTVTFASVAIHAQQTALVAVKAVDANYPLRGALRIALAGGDEVSVQHGPPPGHVWVEHRVLAELGMHLGDTLKLGRSSFTVSARVVVEPDRGAGFIGLAPRLMMNTQDLAATKLLEAGSRATYRLLIAGTPAQIQTFRHAFKPKLKIGETLRNAAESRPSLRAALDRAASFLNLAALVAVILAAVAIAMSAHQHALARYDELALIKTLGAQKGFLMRMLLWQLFLLGLCGALVGVFLGYIAQGILAHLVGGAMDLTLPPAHLLSLVPALITGLVILFGFAWPALAQARHAPPARVFQRSLPLPAWYGRMLWLAALAATAGLVIWRSTDLKLAGSVLAGGGAAAVLLWLSARGAIAGLSRLPMHSFLLRKPGVRLGVQALLRRPQASALLAVGFGVGLSVLFLLILVRGDLLSGWQQNVAASAPNQFVVNIAADQVAGTKAYLQNSGFDDINIFPMVRARLISLNGKPLQGADSKQEDSAEFLNRELNLSWQWPLKSDNKILKGRWWRSDDKGQALVSVEESVADRLGLALGDTLGFDMAGQEFSAQVTSIRKVDWTSMTANFYLLFPPGFLDAYPTTFITSLHVTPSQEDSLGGLVRKYPNISLLNVGALLRQIRHVIDRVSMAVEFVFVFTLLAGALVLFAAVQGSRMQRRNEAAVMRALGAQGRLIKTALLTEFLLVGTLAALLAAVVAQILAIVLATQVFDLEYTIRPMQWMLAIAVSVAGIGTVGMLSVRDILRQPAMTSLR